MSQEQDVVRAQSKLKKFREICEDLDQQKDGYVSTKVFVNVLQNMKEGRKLNETDIQWMQNNSSIKGKVNYKHGLSRQVPESKSYAHLQKSEYQTKQDHRKMQQNMMRSDLESFQHPNDSLIEHFYRKNQIEYPEYQYTGKGTFSTKNDQICSISAEPKRSKSSGKHYVGQRNLWMSSNGFKHSFYNRDSNTSDNLYNSDVSTIEKQMQNKLSYTVGCFKDQVPKFDLRRLYHLRQYLLTQQNKNHYVQNSDQLLNKMKKIIKNDIAYNLIEKLMNQGDTLNVQNLNALIGRLEDSSYYRSYSRDQKYIGSIKQRNKLDSNLSGKIQYIHHMFDQKFKSFHQAFQYFDLSKKGYFTSAEWLKGLRELGQDCLFENEIQGIFSYLDKSQTGQVSIEQFKDVLYYQRNLNINNDYNSTPKINNQQSTASNLTSKLNSSSFEVNNKINKQDFISSDAKSFKTRGLKIKQYLQSNGQVYGKKAERSESIDKIINYEHNRTFCENLMSRQKLYQNRNDSIKKDLYGYSEYKLNKAFEIRSYSNSHKLYQ
ncbi:UNKNOWN [Stylonychia lemnae]|uniref:EF-hand domain-containing protein n=1 Tax=Stylonychia lemnae TaxID=5949 RepID=A0A078AYE6_STYLE|nr:UNKNOWN [Stylonychia lemnae]|eukprot:CDW87156.1 UNKNOWN [Stylonychia lemnae]